MNLPTPFPEGKSEVWAGAAGCRTARRPGCSGTDWVAEAGAGAADGCRRGDPRHAVAEAEEEVDPARGQQLSQPSFLWSYT